MGKDQKDFLHYIVNKYTNDPEENIYPKPMTDAEFRKLITDYLLGDDFYIADPVSQNQANVYMAHEIVSLYKRKDAKR